MSGSDTMLLDEHIQRMQLVEISILALIAYEHLITLSAEIQLVWKRKFSGATALFLANRYLLWVEIGIQLGIAFAENITSRGCTAIGLADIVVIGIHRICIGLFCAIRVYAIWQRNWKPFWLVLSLYLINIVIYLAANFMLDFSPVGPPLGGCKAAARDSSVAVMKRLALASNILTIVSDGTIFLLTLARTLNLRMDGRKLGIKTPMATLILRDGTIYFLSLGFLSILNVISIQLGPKSPIYNHINSFITPLRTILVSRFFLNLRQVFFVEDDGPRSLSSMTVLLPAIPSITAVVGNLGAPLIVCGSGMQTANDESFHEDEVPVVSKKPISVGLRDDIGVDACHDDDPVPLLGGRNRLVSEDPDEEALYEDEDGGGPSGARESYGPWRQPSKSTVDESDTLLVYGDEGEPGKGDEDELSLRASPADSPGVHSLTFVPRTVVYD